MLTHCLMFTCLLIQPETLEPDQFEKPVIEAVEKLGGKAKLDSTLDAIARVSVEFEKADDKLLAQLCKLPSIGAISLFEAQKCTEIGLVLLNELPDLQHLTFGKCNPSDKVLATIGTFKNLTLLTLGDANMTDARMVALKKLERLKSLDLLDSPITDQSIPVLVTLKKLEELNLSGTKITDAGVVELKALEKLKLLRLNRTDVTRKGIDSIEAALPKLIVRW